MLESPPEAIEDNTLADHAFAGIVVYEDSDAPGLRPGALISRNAIKNSGTGIDLVQAPVDTIFDGEGDGSTPNDLTDLDEGPNDLLNSPVILQAVGSGALLLNGFIRGAFGATYTVEVFGNATCGKDPNTALFYGPGETYLGTATVETSATDVGQRAFSLVAEGLAPEYRCVTLPPYGYVLPDDAFAATVVPTTEEGLPELTFTSAAEVSLGYRGDGLPGETDRVAYDPDRGFSVAATRDSTSYTATLTAPAETAPVVTSANLLRAEVGPFIADAG